MTLELLVSIVVPIFNSEEFLRETVESVLAQSYSNWELFLVDDGSNDQSPYIARQYAERYSNKIFYLEHPGHQNCGVCTTRNLGIAHAKGYYIAFLDSDDVWLPNKLERQLEIMRTYPEAGMVFSMSRYWSSWDTSISKLNKDYIPRPNLQVNTLYGPGVLTTRSYPLGKAQAPCPSNILLRRSIVIDVGGFEESFQKSHQLYEDQAFLSKVYLATSVYVANECLDYYRLHKKSCMATTKNYWAIRLFFLEWFEAYLEFKKIDDEKILKALQRAKWPYQHPRLHRLLVISSSIYLQGKNWLKNRLYTILEKLNLNLIISL